MTKTGEWTVGLPVCALWGFLLPIFPKDSCDYCGGPEEPGRTLHKCRHWIEGCTNRYHDGCGEDACSSCTNRDGPFRRQDRARERESEVRTQGQEPEESVPSDLLGDEGKQGTGPGQNSGLPKKKRRLKPNKKSAKEEAVFYGCVFPYRGVWDNWPDCQLAVSGEMGACHKKFEGETWLEDLKQAISTDVAITESTLSETDWQPSDAELQFLRPAS